MFSFFKRKKPKKPPLKFIDLNESNGKLFNEMGIDAKRYNDLEKSIFYFSKAIELQPSVSKYFENRAIVYWEHKKPILAFLDLKNAVLLGSKSAAFLHEKFKKESDDKLHTTNRHNVLLDEVGVHYLYHMTHIDNLKGIIKYGLLSHNEAHKISTFTKDISDNTVNKRRIRFHDYVPLYFNPKNPMLYKRKAIQNKIVIICIKRQLLFSPEIIISDGNAASSSTKFYNSIYELKKIDWNIIRSKYWNDFTDGKRIRCAEALFPEKINITQISQICCNNEDILKQVKKLLKGHTIPVNINQKLYF